MVDLASELHPSEGLVEQIPVFEGCGIHNLLIGHSLMGSGHENCEDCGFGLGSVHLDGLAENGE